MNNLLLVGSGGMAMDYTKVLLAMNYQFTVVGRGNESAVHFEDETGVPVVTGGIEAYISRNREEIPGTAIVAVGAEALENTTLLLLDAGVKNILLEKPGALTISGMEKLSSMARTCAARIIIGYNRRFFSSVLKAKELIEEDGGVTSFHFEFTEWSHVIEPLKKDPSIKDHWVIANSTHVIDLAFFLGGAPAELQAFCKGGLDWHPTSSIFAGAGRTVHGALFSYQANWEGPGRWGLELITKKRRFILRPLENLNVMVLGSVQIEPILIEDQFDLDFKPGLYRQVEAFIAGEAGLCSIQELVSLTKSAYYQIAGY